MALVEWMIVWLPLVIILVLAISMVWTVKKDEVGNKFFFEKMGGKITTDAEGKETLEEEPGGLLYGFCDSGIHLVPHFLPDCGIVTIPKKRFELDYPARLMISEKTEGLEEIYGKQFLLVDTVIYTEFNRNFLAVKQVVERNVPTDEQRLMKFTDGLVDSAFREAIGKIDWGKATAAVGRDIIRQEVEDRIKDPKSIFSLGGLNVQKTAIAIKAVDLESKELKKAIAQLDVEKFQRQAAIYEADRTKIEANAINEIRKALIDQGGFPPEKANDIAPYIYELQVSKDLQLDSGREVVKLIRFETGKATSVADLIAQGTAVHKIAQGLLDKKKETE